MAIEPRSVGRKHPILEPAIYEWSSLSGRDGAKSHTFECLLPGKYDRAMTVQLEVGSRRSPGDNEGPLTPFGSSKPDRPLPAKLG